jgi:hypothetical protein
MRSWFALLAVLCMASAASAVRAEDVCSSCELQLGFGATYHYWGYTHGLVVPIGFTFDHDRWELAAFRFTKSQTFYDTTFAEDVRFATPYWGFSFSRRLELLKLQ